MTFFILFIGLAFSLVNFLSRYESEITKDEFEICIFKTEYASKFTKDEVLICQNKIKKYKQRKNLK